MERGEGTQQAYEPASGDETSTERVEHSKVDRTRVENAIFFLTESEFKSETGMGDTFYSKPKESSAKSVLEQAAGITKIEEDGRTIANHVKVFVFYKDLGSGKLLQREVPSGQTARDFITLQEDSPVAAVSYWKQQSEGSKGNMTRDGGVEWAFAEK